MERGHPYVPSSAPPVRDELLAAIGAHSIEELYAAIPERLRLRRPLELPAALPAEHAVEQEVLRLLARNRGTDELLSFLGGSCWPHLVPAVCDEIARRAEFLTAYWGPVYSDHGKYQAYFEHASLLGELLELDAVSLPVYDWASAAATALRMAARITGRDELLVPRATAPERRRTIQTACAPGLLVREYGHTDRHETDVEELRRLVGPRTAAVYLETPSYLGVIEPDPAAIARIAHDAGALLVAGADPSSLGALAPPGSYGADLACGDLQPLGMHQDFGGGLAGFLASPDEPHLIAEYPTFLIGLAPTEAEGEHGFGLVAWERTSYMRREHGADYGGTTTGLWAIVAAVYLSLLGPEGMRELATGILQRTRYLAERLADVDGLRVLAPDAARFKAVVVDVSASGLSADEVNRRLLTRGILGGIDLSGQLPELGQALLVSVTEAHGQAEIDRLADTLADVLAAA